MLPQAENSALWQPKRGLSVWSENLIKFIFGAFALVSVATTVGIVLTLVFETVEFFQEVSFFRFLTETEWTPLFTDKKFGIFVLITATFMTAAIASLVALPFGLLSAIFLSEYA